MGPDVLLEDQGIGILFVADGALMEHPHGGLGPVDPHVSLEVTFCGEASVADLALEGTLSRVDPVVHLEGRLAREHSVAEHALVGV